MKMLLPDSMHVAIDKIQCGFLWKGRKEVNGGCFLVAWENVQRPLDLGSLRIWNLEIMEGLFKRNGFIWKKPQPIELGVVWTSLHIQMCNQFFPTRWPQMRGMVESLYFGPTDNFMAALDFWNPAPYSRHLTTVHGCRTFGAACHSVDGLMEFL